MRDATTLETTTVGRKTPGDGKLEIRRDTAERLRALGTPVTFRLVRRGAAARLASGTVTAMPCTCAKGAAAGAHEHHFLESPVLRELAVGTTVAVTLGTTGDVELRISGAGPSPERPRAPA